MFIARVSRGRTIHDILQNPGSPLADAGTNDAMFLLLNELPIWQALATLASLVAMLVVALFFATSSDSGSLVVDMLTNGGDPHPVKAQLLFWAVLEGTVAAVLLTAGWAAAGEASVALTPLQTAAVATGLPFSVVMVFMCWGLTRGLSRDRIPTAIRRDKKPPST